MATQYTAGLSAGQILTAATMNQIGATMATYTPAWTGSTTNPVIGNGSISGQYFQIQKLIVGQIFIVCGSTTTYGSGTYRFSVPVAMTGNNTMMSYGQILDASAGYVGYTGSGIYLSSTTFEFRTHAAAAFSPTVPVTLAASDQIRIQFIYEAS